MTSRRPADAAKNEGAALQADLAFLLAQVGSHSQSSFGNKVERYGLRLAHVGVLKAMLRSDGMTQRELGEALGMFPSNLVKLMDELEGKGLVRRGRSTEDRRRYTLQLTGKGRGLAQKLMTLTRAHQDRICTSLAAAERQQLARLLQKIATEQGLKPGVHPELPGLKRGGQRRSSDNTKRLRSNMTFK